MQVPVVVAQVPVSWSVSDNLKTIEAAIAEAGDGALLVLPEAVLSGYDDQLSGLGDLDVEELRAACRTVAGAATRANVHVVCGTLHYEQGQWWNAAVYFPPAGRARIYRKVNLAMHERGRLAAGSALPAMRMVLPSGELSAGIQLHCPSMIVSPRGEVLAQAPAGDATLLRYHADLALVRDDYLAQQRGDVVSVTYQPRHDASPAA
jgi:omega-amidase